MILWEIKEDFFCFILRFIRERASSCGHEWGEGKREREFWADFPLSTEPD